MFGFFAFHHNDGTVEEFLTMFTLQLASKGTHMDEYMTSGHVVYYFSRRPGTGFFFPPSKLSYLQSRVYEVYGDYERMGGGKPYPLLYRTCNDFGKCV